MRGATVFAGKAVGRAKEDRREARFFVKNAATRVKRDAKKELSRAIRRSEHVHIRDY